MPDAPAVRIKVPHLAYGDQTILRDIDLTLEAERWTCLLGPSGIGKTSLIRLVAGIIEGAELQASDSLPVAGRVALMAQQDLLLPWLSCLDNVMIGMKLRGDPADPDRAQKLLADVGLPDIGTRLPDTLSGGMRQRVAIARTLMEDRSIVLMDEPFSSLDALNRHRLQDLAFKLLRGRTVLLVTHNPLEALRLGDVLLIMENGGSALRSLEPPRGSPLRDIDDPTVQQHHGRLMNALLNGGNPI